MLDDFIGTAQAVLTQRHREGLRKLLEFSFKRNSAYNLPADRLMLFTAPAVRITEVKDASSSDPIEFSRTMELWLLQDMSFAVVACVRVQVGEAGFSSEYRTIRAREPSQFKSVIDLNYDLLAAIFYCLGQLKS